MDKLDLLNQNLKIISELAADLQRQISDAKEGTAEKSTNLIMGSLCGIDQTATHIKNIYETMVFIHRK